MKVRITHNLRRLKTELEIKHRRNINDKELARDMRVGYSTIRRYVNDETNRIDLKVVEKILVFFREEGFEIGLEDLFNVEITE